MKPSEDDFYDGIFRESAGDAESAPGSEPTAETALLTEFDEANYVPRRVLPAKKRKGLRITAIVLAMIIGWIAGLGGFYTWSVSAALADMDRNESMMPTSSERPTRQPSDLDGQALNFMLLGTDIDEYGSSRSDSLIVAHLTADRKHLYLISFTRDMWVYIPGHGYSKINAAYSLGGPALTVETVESLLDVPMDFAVAIDYDGFMELTTILGGVTVYNEFETVTEGVHLPQGYITIQGWEALSYVRERYNLPNGDLDRAARQRQVLKAIIEKATSPAVLGNPVKLSAMIKHVGSIAEVDSGLTGDVILSLATSLKFGPDSIRTLQAPISGFGKSPDGLQDVNVVDQYRLTQLGNALRDGTMEEYYLANQP